MLGMPMWLETTAPDVDAQKPDANFHQLLIAQDTGGAIKGAVRADVYWGVGHDAEQKAGRMRSTGTMTVFLPKSLAARLGANVTLAKPAP
jgi:membrane-bound lytic murein transglycosylase A